MNYFNEDGSLTLPVEAYFDTDHSVAVEVVDEIDILISTIIFDVDSDILMLHFADRLETIYASAYYLYLNGG